MVEDQQVSEPHRRTQVVQEVSQRIAELSGSRQGPLRVRHRKTTGHSSFAETELMPGSLSYRGGGESWIAINLVSLPLLHSATRTYRGVGHVVSGRTEKCPSTTVSL